MDPDPTIQQDAIGDLTAEQPAVKTPGANDRQSWTASGLERRRRALSRVARGKAYPIEEVDPLIADAVATVEEHARALQAAEDGKKRLADDRRKLRDLVAALQDQLAGHEQYEPPAMATATVAEVQLQAEEHAARIRAEGHRDAERVRRNAEEDAARIRADAHLAGGHQLARPKPTNDPISDTAHLAGWVATARPVVLTLLAELDQVGGQLQALLPAVQQALPLEPLDVTEVEPADR